MPKQTNNVSEISNQDLFLLKKVSDSVDQITIKVGKKNFELTGIEASIITTGSLTFLALPSVYAVFNGSTVVPTNETKGALRELKASTKKPGKSARSKVELPTDLAKQLTDFAKANNARVMLDPSGGYKIQKIRGKRKG